MLKYVGKGGTKSIFMDISAYKAHINSILMSKHTFVRSTNSMEAIQICILNRHLGIQDGCHGILFCFIVSINHHEQFVLRGKTN